jgi:AcrR family transcriptional regulator
MPSPSTDPRATLRRGTVLATAVALADAEGLEAVSMRRLADALGVVPMALYKHVADKEDLLDGMVDTVIGEVPPTSALRADQWRAAVHETLLATRAVVARHPWARRALETRTVRTPVVLGHMERVSQLFLRAGFSPDLTHHVMHLLGTRIWGFSAELFDESAGGARERRRTSGEPDPRDYPGILAIAADARARRPGATGCDEDFEFTFALDLLLDVIARLRRSGWESPVPTTPTPEGPDPR